MALRMYVKALWRRSVALDRLAIAVVFLSAMYGAAALLDWLPSGAEPSVAVVFLLILIFLAATTYLIVRGRSWMGHRLLWSLRNRLIIAYIFIAFVPVVLLLAMGGILTYMGEVEVAAHLLHEDVNSHLQQMVAVSREALAMARVTAPAGAALESLDASAPIQVLGELSQQRLPGLALDFLPGRAQNEIPVSPDTGEFVERNGALWIEGATAGQLADGRRVVVIARLPVTSLFLDGLAADLGPITLGRPQSQAELMPRGGPAELLGPNATASIESSVQTLPPPRDLFDIGIVGATTFEAVRYAGANRAPVALDLVATFAMRSSSMGRRIEGSLGEFASLYVILLAVVGGLFVVLWLLALIAGMVLTRTVTGMVAKLDEATHHVKAGDFTHRISIVHRDQLGALAESFNSMTDSIQQLLAAQREHQRLENELAIAREVQSQLFPRTLPEAPGLELGAVCHAARIVSGDYYDCLQLDAHQVGLAVADISGKGISAALLMASLNAALRSLVLSDGSGDIDTGALAARLNRHLLLNSTDDRYATFFFAVYDSSSRALRYTNAGHLAPVLISGNRVERLERGGTVIGLLDHCAYEQAMVSVAPGSLLVAYSDGMTEPENPAGEEFGADRLIAEVLRRRNDPPARLCNELIEAVKSWCAPAEPFDDQTVLIARMD